MFIFRICIDADSLSTVLYLSLSLLLSDLLFNYICTDRRPHLPYHICTITQYSPQQGESTLIKKKILFSSYVWKFRMEQLQSHIWLTATSYMVKYLRISSYIRKLFLIYAKFCNCSILNSLYMRKIFFSFLSVYFRRIGFIHWCFIYIILRFVQREYPISTLYWPVQ